MKYNLLLWILIFIVILFMVLKDDNINQSMLVPLDLRNLIPKNHPCYFIKNVVDLIDCSKANQEFRGTLGEFVYPRELLLKLILMSVSTEDYLQEKLGGKQELILHICTLQQ